MKIVDIKDIGHLSSFLKENSANYKFIYLNGYIRANNEKLDGGEVVYYILPWRSSFSILSKFPIINTNLFEQLTVLFPLSKNFLDFPQKAILLDDYYSFAKKLHKLISLA